MLIYRSIFNSNASLLALLLAAINSNQPPLARRQYTRTKQLNIYKTTITQTVEIIEEGVKDLSNKKLKEKASDLVILIIVCGNIHLLSNIQCDVKVKIDINNIVSNNNLVKDNSILIVFIKKQSNAGAVAAPLYKTITTDLKEVGWVIIRVERSFILLGNPLVRFFR